jgi:hypothetical protein
VKDIEMSGRKQHFIPQCLLRQFATRCNGKATYVVVYRQGQMPFTTATTGIAAQRDFYSAVAQPGTRALDDEITAYEDKLAPMLKSLRSTAPSASVNASVAAEVVTHLTTRGAFFRDLFSQGAQDLLARVGSLFNAEPVTRLVLGIDDAVPRDLVADAVSGAYEELPCAVKGQLPKPLFLRIASVFFRENFQQIHGAVAPQLQLALARLQHELPDAIRKGHAKVLGQDMAPGLRKAAFEALEWKVVTYGEPSLVLPDCVALGEQSDGTFRPLQVQENGTPVRVLLPLSDRCLLIGQKPGLPLEDIAADEFNRCAAASCWDFFIASQKSERLQALATSIQQLSHGFIQGVNGCQEALFSGCEDAVPVFWL